GSPDVCSPALSPAVYRGPAPKQGEARPNRDSDPEEPDPRPRPFVCQDRLMDSGDSGSFIGRRGAKPDATGVLSLEMAGHPRSWCAERDPRAHPRTPREQPAGQDSTLHRIATRRVNDADNKTVVACPCTCRDPRGRGLAPLAESGE